MGPIDRLIGSFAGSGSWYDATGKSQTYTVVQTIREAPGGFEIVFHHAFEDASVTNAHVVTEWIAPFVFSVLAAGRVVGNGYCFDGYCHYHLELGGKFVEASYSLGVDGMKVYGSSTSNAEGQYIAWSENLSRTSQYKT